MKGGGEIENSEDGIVRGKNAVKLERDLEKGQKKLEISFQRSPHTPGVHSF